MIQHLSTYNWMELLSRSPEEQEKLITSRISEACAIYIPLHVPNRHNNQKYPGAVRRLLNRKRSQWARFVRTQCDIDYASYLDLRRQCVLAIRDYKRRSDSQLLARAHNSPKLLFRYIRSKRKTKPSPLSLTTRTGDISSSPMEAAETLALTYQAIFASNDSTTCTPSPLPLPLPTHLLTNISFPIFKVEKLLTLCDPGGSPGPDGIHPRVLKECASVLALPYSILFSSSFATGHLPSSWKQAIIHPIYKGGSRHDPGNYRPISLTSIPCKIMEKIINRSLQTFLTSHNLLHPSQHGFLPSRSCLTNLSSFFDDLSKAAELRCKVDCIFFDFSKAFDVISHNLTVCHWERIGVRGLLSRWLTAFIRNRSSRVRIAGTFSSVIQVTSGVPQGSVLGPTLFLMFINNLPSVIPPGSKSLLFADDLKVWSDDPITLQKAIDACSLWSQVNHLPFNPSKTEHMSFIKPASVAFTLPSSSGPLSIPTVDERKDLGVWMTPNLSPSLMCLHSAKKAIRMVHLLHRTFPSIDPRSFITLYSSFVRPLLEHCNFVWLPWLKRDENLLENVQRKATKTVPSLRNLSYPVRRSRLKLFSLKYRRLRGCLIYTYRLFQSHEQNQFFSLSRTSHLRGHSRKLFLERFSSRPRRNFFSSIVVSLWNKLPESAISAPSLQSFKRAIDNVLPTLLAQPQ
jgi:hypothetical protein